MSHDHHDLFIAGRLTPARSEAVLTTINPATEEPAGSAPDAGADDVDAAVQAARAAFRESGWPQLAPKERARHLRALADEFEKHNDELGALVTMENGMALSISGAFNGIGSATRYRYFVGLAESWAPEEVRDYPEAPSGPAKIKTIVRREPAGVVGIIVPWNAPQGNVAAKLGAALAAGCTAVIKPSPETPLDSYFLAQAATDAGIPPGVVNVVTGGDATGAALVAHSNTRGDAHRRSPPPVHGDRPEGLDRGYYVEPTVFSGVRNDMRIAREEIFGPVLAVIRYDNEEEAIAIANDSEYGLGGTVFTRDVEHGLDIARRVETGSIGVNFAGMAPNAPFGGVKNSGIGRESGPEGFEEYTTTKSIARQA